MIPGIEEAHCLLREAENCNPGPWGDHSRNVAMCAEKIAAAVGMDSTKAYVLGLLHDVGRKFGKGHLAHVWDGFCYMMELGFDEAARICLTHSFNTGDFNQFIGKKDIPDEQIAELKEALAQTRMDEYDRLIQLCDGLATSQGVVDLEWRMHDVRRRYGYYPQKQWDANLALLEEFSRRAGSNIYDIIK